MPPAAPARSDAAKREWGPRTAGAFIAVLGGSAAIVTAGHLHYPIQEWLFWRLATYAAVCAFWAFACLSAGRWTLDRLRLTELPFFDRMAVAFASGIVVFFWGMFAAGLAGALAPWFAVIWPVVLAALDGRRTVRALYRSWVRAIRLPPRRWGELAATAFGLAGLGMIYFTILTPDNLGFDTRWYHFPIAEHFVAAGRIGPFQEGWYLGAYPHLASVIYTWAFLLPMTTLFDRVVLAAHLEFVFFLATLASIPLMVRRLVGARVPRGSWGALFLFPCVFLYDGGLFGAADHVLASFAIPVYLCLARAARRATPRRCAALAIMLSGALLTKYQASYLLLPASALLAVAVLWRLATKTAARLEIAGPVVAVGVGLALTAPHWLANWIWYGDPLYPLLHAHLSSRPFTPGALGKFDTFLGTHLWRPHGGFAEKAAATVRTLVTFAFEPHDWATYHGSTPVFGALFTVASFVALALPRARAIRQSIAMTLAGVAIWFLTSHQDRYLQCLLPWMVAATVAVGIEAWGQLRALRPFLALPVGLQLVWGGDVYFIPANDESYEVDRPSPIKAAIDLVSAGYRGERAVALHPFSEWEHIGASLPRGAKALLHERYLHLGLGAMSVSDLPGWQGGISYDDVSAPHEIFGLLTAMGVTHLVWETGVSHEHASVASDVAFFHFVDRFAEGHQRVGNYTIARMPAVRPPAHAPKFIQYECGHPEALTAVESVVSPHDCPDAPLRDGFHRVAVRGTSEIWIKN
ncbi:MAG TPA: hypothetical protein VJT73_06385 [Polyangiaceae bacterium]|nr:hypothetical protein [Polyangiaceae bacterium]